MPPASMSINWTSGFPTTKRLARPAVKTIVTGGMPRPAIDSAAVSCSADGSMDRAAAAALRPRSPSNHGDSVAGKPDHASAVQLHLRDGVFAEFIDQLRHFLSSPTGTPSFHGLVGELREAGDVDVTRRRTPGPTARGRRPPHGADPRADTRSATQRPMVDRDWTSRLRSHLAPRIQPPIAVRQIVLAFGSNSWLTVSR